MRTRLARDLHPVAWWVWAIGLATAATLTTNPFLLLLLVAVAAVVVQARRSDHPWARSFRLYVWLGVAIVLIRVVFRIVFGGVDGGHVLLDLPTVPLPEWVAGVRLLGPLTRREPARRPVRRPAPGHHRHLRRCGQLAGQPQAAADVGAAGALRDRHGPGRGRHRASRSWPTAPAGCAPPRRCAGEPTGAWAGCVASWSPSWRTPWSARCALAAGMDTRGYGRAGTATPAERRLTGALLLGALCGIGVGTYAVLDSTAPRWLATPMLLVGVVVAVVGMVTSGRRVQRSRYRPDPWRLEESLVALSGLAVGAVVWWIAGHDVLVAHPGVESMPYLSVEALAAVLIGLLPAVVAPRPRHALAPALAVGA